MVLEEVEVWAGPCCLPGLRGGSFPPPPDTCRIPGSEMQPGLGDEALGLETHPGLGDTPWSLRCSPSVSAPSAPASLFSLYQDTSPQIRSLATPARCSLNRWPLQRPDKRNAPLLRCREIILAHTGVNSSTMLTEIVCLWPIKCTLSVCFNH